jgi:hypothetical protein
MEIPETGTDMEAAGIFSETGRMDQGETAPDRQMRNPVQQIRLT